MLLFVGTRLLAYPLFLMFIVFKLAYMVRELCFLGALVQQGRYAALLAGNGTVEQQITIYAASLSLLLGPLLLLHAYFCYCELKALAVEQGVDEAILRPWRSTFGGVSLLLKVA